MKTMIVTALLMALGASAGAVELEFQAKGEPAQLLSFQMNGQAKSVGIKSVNSAEPLCHAHAEDKENRCQEEAAKKPIQPMVKVVWRGMIGDSGLILVAENVCDARTVIKGPNHATTGAAQFLLMPADCHEFSRFVKVPMGTAVALVSQEGQQFVGHYTVKLSNVTP